MIIKKLIMSVAAFGLLALSPISFSKADSEIENYEQDAAFYVKGFYNGAKVHETKEIKDAKNADNTDNTDYKPKYELNKLGGGAAIGYSFAGMRVELEGLMSTEIKTETDSQIFKLSNDKQYKNEGFKHMTGMINAYYDLALSDDVTPYVGVGAGMSRVTNTTQDLKAWHIALQGKAGVMLNMGKSFVPYVGYRALWLMEKEYPDQKEWLSSGTPANPAQFKINHIIHNVEAGFLLPINV